ncbi:hypothetical protein V6N11_051957 [Hibiscus sabdariffa]|uniref:Secreted protein n=1 Tax=Hibiscus sabdariffa TaxID=183260 RepID=A0ABR2U8S8_9ROSI
MVSLATSILLVVPDPMSLAPQIPIWGMVAGWYATVSTNTCTNLNHNVDCELEQFASLKRLHDNNLTPTRTPGLVETKFPLPLPRQLMLLMKSCFPLP